VTLVPGDYTGAENCAAVREVLAASGADIAWEEHPAITGHITPEFLESALRTKTVLMGHHYGERVPGLPAPIVTLRRELGVFATLRPAKSIPALNPRHTGVDLVVIREATEDVYAGLEHETIPGVFESLKVTTHTACERISRFAFDWARRTGRNKVTIVHKANILKKSDGLFLRTALEVAEAYPDIAHEDVIVDALCMKLTMDPARFQTLLCGNLFGDIVSDLASGLVGGKWNSPSANVGPDGLTVFTTGHADPPANAGTGRNTPLGLLFASLLMLRDLGEAATADRIRDAIHDALGEGVLPYGVGGTATSAELTTAVIRRLE
jgi:isocitrate dehydrogenase (NAD+)